MMFKPVNVDDYIQHHEKYSDILNFLRSLLLDTEMDETLKWNMPTYTIKGKNVITLAAFKHHAGLWFHQGSFLTDPLGVLDNAQEGKTKGMRHWRWAKLDDIDGEQVIAYIEEAIENEHQGKRIKIKRSTPTYEMHPIFAEALKKNKAEAAFKELSKSKQKDYAEYISTAKRESTKQSRLAKIIPMILRGEGLNDKYQK